MKFKAAVRDARTFAAVCNSTRGFQKKCIVKFDPKNIRVIAQTGVADGSQLWTRLHTATTLSDVRLESRMSGVDVWCEVQETTQLTAALRCCERSTNSTIRLAKADQRQLLKLSMQSAATGHDMVHEVAVRVLSEAEVRAIVPMALAEDHIQVYLPRFADIARFVDRARSAGCLCISFAAALGAFADGAAGENGGGGGVRSASLTISAEAPVAALASQHSALVAPNADTTALTEADVTVDIKKLSRFLGVRELAPDQIIFHIVPGQALVISAHGQSDSSLVYYLPALLRH